MSRSSFRTSPSRQFTSPAMSSGIVVADSLLVVAVLRLRAVALAFATALEHSVRFCGVASRHARHACNGASIRTGFSLCFISSR